jgi:hypothetical protein
MEAEYGSGCHAKVGGVCPALTDGTVTVEQTPDVNSACPVRLTTSKPIGSILSLHHHRRHYQLHRILCTTHASPDCMAPCI